MIYVTEENDIRFMRRAIELAKKGEGWCHPNPMVGAVIVKNGKIIGEGYHRKCGELHAERNAISSLQESAEGATLYVTLEPCCHWGRTPPCTDAILENHFRRVVIGSRDPNPKVHGKGAAILRNAGIEVQEDFLREECDALNPVFFHYITTKTPYFIMKYAMTADGKICTKTGASRWITGEESRHRVHEMRHACMGIMVGIGTVLADDPMLNCRLENGRDPTRIICDSHLRLPLNSQISRSAGRIPTVDVCAEGTCPVGEWSNGTEGIPIEAKELLKKGVRIWNFPSADGEVDLKALSIFLGQNEIDSVLLEGGAGLNESALREGIVQEVHVFLAPKIFGGTAKSPVEGKGVDKPDEAYQMRLMYTEYVGEDLLLIYRR